MAGVSMIVEAAPSSHGTGGPFGILMEGGHGGPLEIPSARAVPGLLPRFRGFALRLAGPDETTEWFEIAGIDADGTDAVVLGPFPEEEVVAVWRALAGASGLPLLLQHGDGSFQAPYPQIGGVQLGAIRIRRRHGLPSGRRPRFLVRRKTGRHTSRPLVYREREIAAGERG